MGVVFGQSEPPFEEFEVFGPYKFFHSVLPYGLASLADDFQAVACAP